MLNFLSLILSKEETDREGFWENIKNTRSQHYKCCTIFWFLIQAVCDVEVTDNVGQNTTTSSLLAGC
jgi:hypothetical protein